MAWKGEIRALAELIGGGCLVQGGNDCLLVSARGRHVTTIHQG